MKSYVNALWLLFWGEVVALVSGVAGMILNATWQHSGASIDLYYAIPSIITGAISLIGSVVSVIALVRLSRRNRRLDKAKILLIAELAVAAAMLAGLLAIYIIQMATPGYPLIGGSLNGLFSGSVATLVLGLMAAFQLLYGLADMAEEASAMRHARRLFAISIVVAVALSIGPTILLVVISNNITAMWNYNTSINIAGILVSICRLWLYHGSIVVERDCEKRIQPQT